MELWTNLHLVDNETAPATGGPGCKIQPLLDILTDRLLMRYNPGQELSVDEGVVKYKGYRAEGKVHMPKNPVKLDYKMCHGAAPVLVVVICVIIFKSMMTEPQTQRVGK